ncbi:MAG: hypothetical protein IJO83_04825 [Clostridia bacterium]|nr:hypothetical protein [Clostridia bacterium]
MKMITRGAALTLAAVLLSGTVAFAEGAVLPVRATLEEKGFEVSWKQDEKTVVIRDGGFVVEEKVGEKVSLDYDVTYAEESFFEEVDAMKKAYEDYSTKATVTEVGEGYFLADTEKLGEVMFRVDDNTHFHHEMNRMLYRFNDVTVGASLKVYFAETMTASIPPQTYAKEVVFLNEAQEEEKMFAEATVTEVGEKFILAQTETMGEVMFMVSEETNIHHEMNRRFYTIADLEAGMVIKVNHAEAMTASLPPQVAAYEIIIMNAEEVKAENVTTSGKIVKIGEGSFTVEKEDGSRVQFNVSEETFYHHVMNRMLYRFESLEEGMTVDVIHADAMTFSLPPQAVAIEVIVK